jgi:hypothetical protein
MKRKKKEPKVGGADLLQVPGMEALDDLTRKILKIPKDEVERREKDWRDAKRGPAKSG